MLRDHLSQTCQLRRKTGTDQRGRPIYSEEETIDCRLVEKFQLVQKPNGETVPVSHICYTETAVAVGDQLNGDTVHGVDVWRDHDGEAIGYKAVM